MSSSSESDSERRQPKIKKIQSEKLFKTYWLDDPAFKKWLLPDITSKYRARCKICNATLNSGKSELLKHAATKKHINKMKTVKGSKSIDQMFNKDITHETNVKKAEIKLAAFFAANNVAFHLIDQLEPVLKEIFPDSKICQEMSLKQTKCTEIIRNVLCKKETEDLVSDLKETNFSILIDESTDIGDSKSLAVLARYSKLGQIKTRLLELIQLDARDLGATHLYAALKSCFERHGIPLKNIVGVACDGASVMVGKNHSVFQLLQNDISHLILLRCICHSAALVASHACTFLPRSTEELLRGVYNYSSGSAKRSAQLQEMQILFNDKKSKILKLSTTRWLSRYDCVCRVLENWIALENYFTIAVQEDKLKSAEIILNNLKNPFIKVGNTDSNKHSVYELLGTETIEFKINKCLNFTIFKDDYKPKEICNECLVKLEQFSNFIDICVEVNQRFDSFFLTKDSFPLKNVAVTDLVQQKSVIVKNTPEKYSNNYVKALPLENLKINLTISEDVIQIVENSNLNDDGMNTKIRYVQNMPDGNTTVLRHSSILENHEMPSSDFYSNHLSYEHARVDETVQFVNKNCTEILPSNNQLNLNNAIAEYDVENVNEKSNYDESNKGNLKNDDNLVTLESVKSKLDITKAIPTPKINTQKKYECPSCSKIFIRRLSLNSHIALHTKNRPFICSKCGKAFPIKSELTIHKKVHSEQYQCKLCMKSFVVPSKLKRHVRTHTNEKPFKCDFPNCDKMFSDQSNLFEHKETHKDGRNLKCDSCEKYFKTKNQLKSHRLSHKSDVLFTCDICKKSYKYKTNLIFHMKKHTGYVCPFCYLDCGKLSTLVKHRKECNKNKNKR